MASHPPAILAAIALFVLAIGCGGQTDESPGVVDSTVPSDGGDTAVDSTTTPDTPDSSTVPDAVGDTAPDAAVDAVDAACEAGQTSCGGVCVDTKTSPTNCGKCGNTCCAGAVCSVGACALGCGAGTTSCAKTGCSCEPCAECIDLATNPSHCGTCTTVCGLGEVCSSGICRKIDAGAGG
jgi:hypothetical protein